MSQRSTLDQVQSAVGKEKIEIVAREIDRIREQMQFHEQASNDIDEAIETLSLNDLAEKHGVGVRSLRVRIGDVMGAQSVIKMGHSWVVRKKIWAEFLRKAEMGA